MLQLEQEDERILTPVRQGEGNAERGGDGGASTSSSFGGGGGGAGSDVREAGPQLASLITSSLPSPPLAARRKRRGGEASDGHASPRALPPSLSRMAAASAALAPASSTPALSPTKPVDELSASTGARDAATAARKAAEAVPPPPANLEHRALGACSAVGATNARPGRASTSPAAIEALQRESDIDAVCAAVCRLLGPPEGMTSVDGTSAVGGLDAAAVSRVALMAACRRDDAVRAALGLPTRWLDGDARCPDRDGTRCALAPVSLDATSAARALAGATVSRLSSA